MHFSWNKAKNTLLINTIVDWGTINLVIKNTSIIMQLRNDDAE